MALNFSLTSSAIKTFADKTDMKEFNQLLKPILIPRTVGSDGHTQVEEVCFYLDMS